MSVAHHAGAIAGVVFLLAGRSLCAQSGGSELTPRELSDSVYAVRLQVERLADMVRHGRPAPHVASLPEVAAAITQLGAAANAASRPVPRPHQDLGVLWDYQIAVQQVTPEGPAHLRVDGVAFLATQRVEMPVTLQFERAPNRTWQLVGERGFVAQLKAMAKQLTAKVLQ